MERRRRKERKSKKRQLWVNLCVEIEGGSRQSDSSRLKLKRSTRIMIVFVIPTRKQSPRGGRGERGEWEREGWGEG